MTPKLRAFALALLLIVGADAGSKWAVERSLASGDRLEVIEGFFYLTHVRNEAAVFGLLSDWEYPGKVGVLVAAFGVALGVVMLHLRSLAPGDRRAAFVLGTVLGGALANLIGRLRSGEVIDLLHFQLGADSTGADINLADAALVLGVGWLVLDLLVREGAARAAPGDPEDSPRGR